MVEATIYIFNFVPFVFFEWGTENSDDFGRIYYSEGGNYSCVRNARTSDNCLIALVSLICKVLI